MLDQIRKELCENLINMIEAGTFVKKEIVIFGSNEPAEYMTKVLKEHALFPVCYVDNNGRKQGASIGGILVKSPKSGLLPYKTSRIILIASKYYKEMVSELSQMGYEGEKEIVNMLPNQKESVEQDCSVEGVQGKLKEVEQGIELFQSLKEKLQWKYVFVCPYPALGDIYLAMGYVPRYCEKQGIREYAVLVPKGACVKVANLFQKDRVLGLTKEEMDLVVRTGLFLGLDHLKMMIVHQRFPLVSQLGRLGNYKEIDFRSLYARGIFGLDKEAFERPKYTGSKDKAKEFMMEFELPIGNTVVLAPYANSVVEFPSTFWEDVVARCKEAGYHVITNSSGESEPAIDGTKGVFVPISEMIPFVEAAGLFIGIRSGIVDVIESAKVRKIILYPDRVYQDGSLIDFFGLEKMGFGNEVEEYVIREEALNRYA